MLGHISFVLFWSCFQLEQLKGSPGEGRTALGAAWGSGPDGGQALRGGPRHRDPLPMPPVGRRQEGEASTPNQKHSGGGSGAVSMI